MPFLTLLLEVVSSQKRAAAAAPAPGAAGWYRALLRALSPEQEALSESCNLCGSSTYITVTPLKGEEGGHMLRVTVSGLHALMATHALLAALAEQPVLHYERQPYQVLSANLARSPLSSVRTWADLLAASPSTRPAVCLRFITPTIFTTPADGSAQGECFPQPLQVFSRLLARWNWLGGPALPPGILSWLRSDACLVTDYRLRAGPIPAGGACEPTTVCLGWQGWVAYACREPQSEFMASLQALARLACFTGVGDRTEVGLGMTQIVESR